MHGAHGLREASIVDVQHIQVRRRRTCREARAPKELSSARLCDPPEALSWKEIGLPPRRNCRNSPPIEVGVSSSFKMNSSVLQKQM